jgi:hypothetical protein
MQKTSNFDMGHTVTGKVADTEKFLRRNGQGLCDLFHALDAPTGSDALSDLHRIFARPNPEPKTIERELDAMERTLARQAASTVDKAAREWSFDAAAAVRWHGARISELLARFRNER